MRISSKVVTAVTVVVAVFSTVTVARAGSTGPVVIHDGQASTDPYGTEQIVGANNTAGDPGEYAQPNTEVEPSIAVDPANSQHIVTAFQEDRVDGGGDADNGFATSFDGGQTWTYGNLPGLTKSAPDPVSVSGDCPTSPTTAAPFDRASDAVVAFGKDPDAATDHTYDGYYVYVSSLVFDDQTCSGLPSGMAVNTSSDGGKTWSTVILEADGLDGLNDKNWIVADNGSGTGHDTGRVYVFWDKVAASLAYSYCDPDGTVAQATGNVGCQFGANWSSVNNNSWYTLTPITGIGAQPLVLTDGSVGVLYDNEDAVGGPCNNDPTDDQCIDSSGSDISWTVIPAAGATPWPNALPSTETPINITPYDSNGITDQRAGSLPQAAVDPNTDEVYIVWEDNRYRTDGGTAQGSDKSNQNDALIMFSKPLAAGDYPGIAPDAWSGPYVIDPGPEDNYVDHYNPTVAVGSDDIVRVAYRQRDENPADGFNVATGRGTPIDTYYQESTDGQTWSTPLRVDTVQDTPDAGYGAYDTTNVAAGLFEGDYEQIAAGGYDESYVTRDEAYDGQPGVSVPRDFSSSETPSDEQWQQTWVAHIAPPPANSTPETGIVPGLLLVGAAVGGVVYARRRRRSPLAV